MITQENLTLILDLADGFGFHAADDLDGVIQAWSLVLADSLNGSDASARATGLQNALMLAGLKSMVFLSSPRDIIRTHVMVTS